MGIFLNSKMPYTEYRAIALDTYFVDKTELLADLIPAFGKKNRFFCITRPRRFGKSVMANMVASFFGKAQDAGSLFASMAISKHKDYAQYLNRYQLIYIDFSRMPERCGSYAAYMERILHGLKKDLAEQYADLNLDQADAVWDILQNIFEKTLERFVFVLDEWDAIFGKPFVTIEDRKEFLDFLRELLKGQSYVGLAYMTGVLPIAKYSSGSELNMFLEYDMATKKKFSEYFGFSDAEVDRLFARYQRTTEHAQITREDLRIWYDGYCTVEGKRIYNPHSIVCALTDNELSNYWTGSGPYDEIFYYIRNNIKDVRDDIVWMMSGEKIPIVLQGYAATRPELENKNQIYSAMVVYGLLAYEKKTVSIPNKELMDKFNELVLTNENLGYVYRLAKESEKMLAATLANDTKTMARILKYAHDTEAPIFSYNNETELSAVVNLVYLAARDRYRIEREDKAGEGFVDFIFYPLIRSDDALILELKINASAEQAIDQIKKKGYALRFRGKLGEAQKYTGRILAAGISYHKKTKEHFCKVEQLL